MVKYTLKRLDKPSAIDVDLFAYQEEIGLVTETAAVLIHKLRNLKLLRKKELNVVKGEVYGLYHYNFKVPCSSKKMSKTEDLIRKEAEGLGLEEQEEEEKWGKA